MKQTLFEEAIHMYGGLKLHVSWRMIRRGLLICRRLRLQASGNVLAIVDTLTSAEGFS